MNENELYPSGPLDVEIRYAKDCVIIFNIYMYVHWIVCH